MICPACWRRGLRAGALLLTGLLAGPVLAFPQVPLEGYADARWLSFERRLRELNGGRAGKPVGILQLGDSHTAGEYLSGRIRQRFQNAFGNAGPGILPPGPVKDHPLFQARVLPSSQWVTVRERKPGKSAASPTGLGGIAAYGSAPYQSAMFELPRAVELSQVYVYSSGSLEPGSRYRLYQDGQELAPGAGLPADEIRTVFDLASATPRLTLLSRGGADETRILGLTGVARKPGVAFSNIGVNGARLGILQEWDSAVARAQLRDFAPALVILAFGTNDVVDPDFSREQFADELRRTADWLRRNAPDSAVLMVVPPHAPAFRERSSQNLDTPRSLMRQFAADQRWRIWDWSALVSRNCYVSCFNTDSGPAFQGDGIHLTRKGYELTADALFDAIVSGVR